MNARTLVLASSLVAFASATPAQATPNIFDGTVEEVVVDDFGAGTATFGGGQVLFRSFSFVPEHAGGIYVSTSRLGGAYANPITVSFSQPLTDVSVLAINVGPAPTHVVVNGSAPFFVGAGGTRSLPLGAGPFTSLTISQTDDGGQLVAEWDFGILAIFTSQGRIDLDATPPPAPVGIPFTTIATDGTPFPDGTDTLQNLFVNVSLDDGVVPFRGTGAMSPGGIFTGSGGALSTIADHTTPIPDGTGTFTTFDIPVISGERVAFEAFGSDAQSGIYLASSGSLTKVADEDDPIPGGVGNFTEFVSLAVSSSRVALQAIGTSSQSGIYVSTNGTLGRIADENTVAPGGGLFASFGRPVISEQIVAFRARVDVPDGMGGSTSLPGVYRYSFADESLAAIADASTPVPGGDGTFEDFAAIAVYGTTVAFVGSAGDESAIYASSNGSLTELIDTGTPIPGGAFDFTRFGTVALSGEALLFEGDGIWGQSALYRLHDGVLTKVIGAHEAIGGRALVDPRMSPFSIDGADIAFGASLSFLGPVPPGFGIYRTTLSPACGDGAVGGGEECDDGNSADGDGCSAACEIEPPVCGDGRIGPPDEECDDGNDEDGDGCSAACRIEDFCTQMCARPEARHVAQSNMALVGTAGDDILCGDDRPNTLRGNRGDDVLCGFGGDDTINGNQDDDVLDGGEGDDVLRGDDGEDSLSGGPGEDTLYGGAGADDLQGGVGDDTLRGGSRDDALDGGDDSDKLYGEAGSDACANGEAVRTCEAY